MNLSSKMEFNQSNICTIPLYFIILTSRHVLSITDADRMFTALKRSAISQQFFIFRRGESRRLARIDGDKRVVDDFVKRKELS